LRHSAGLGSAAFKRANHAPLLFRLPGQQAGAVVSKGPSSYAEFVDIYPTLADLAGIPVPPRCQDASASASAPSCTEGASLGDVVRSPTTAHAKTAAFYQWPMKGGWMGYSMATTIDGYTVRYTEWVRYDKAAHAGNWTDRAGVELYNHTADPGENVNLAGTAAYEGAEAALSKRLHAGWRAVL
jgi:iduronate 2-sulfatase